MDDEPETAEPDLLGLAEAEFDGWGLRLAGISGKSRSRYFGLWSQDPPARLRLSDHAVAYESSDCAVCVGTADDDDFRIDEGDLAATCEAAVVSLIRATLAAEVKSRIGSIESDLWHDEGREPTPEESADFPARARAEEIASLREFAAKWARQWGKLIDRAVESR